MSRLPLRSTYIDNEDESLTVLDRLLEPAINADDLGNSTRMTVLGSIERDLVLLLNTRREDVVIPKDYEEASTSILNFGVPESARYGNLGTPGDQIKFCKSLEEAVCTFEPRLSRVSVRPVESEKGRPTVRFRIEATVDALQLREVFEIGFHRDTGTLSVTTGRYR
jgi:type VI secretion system lysozyme-like protein